MLWEEEEGATGVQTDAGMPAGEVGGSFFGEIVVNRVEVEVPGVPSFSLKEVVEENCSPFGA